MPTSTMARLLALVLAFAPLGARAQEELAPPQTEDEISDDAFADEGDNAFAGSAGRYPPDGDGHHPGFADREFDAAFGDGEGGAAETPDEAAEPTDMSPNADEPSPPAADEEEIPVDPRDDPADRRRWLLNNTYLGPTGGIYVPDARAAAPGTFRVQLGFEFFYRDGFLAEGDQHSHVGGALSLSAGLHELVELHGSIHAYANSNIMEFPTVLLTLGDTRLGVKIGKRVSEGLSVGGDLTLRLPTSGDLGPALDALGGTLSALLTYDLRDRESPLPLLLRGRVGYTVDNSVNLVDDVEDYRYSILDGARRRFEETRHFVSRYEGYALDINRMDFVEIGLSAEGRFAYREWRFEPVLEFNWRIPVNRTGFECARVIGSTAPNDRDGCLNDEGVSSFPATLSLLFRVAPPVDDQLSLFAGLDIGLTGRDRDQVVRELAANDPWKLMLGLQWAYDARPPVPDITLEERLVEVPIEPALEPRGRVHGVVVARMDDGTMVQVPTPTVTYLDREATAQRPDEDGSFVSRAFSPGPVTMLVEAPDHDRGDCRVEIPPEGGDVDALCELIFLPEEQLVVVEDEEVIILEQIQFAFDSAEILPESFSLMAQIAATIRDNPQITLIEIQGHTDDQGNEEYNLDLSTRRGISVRAWLIDHGIDPRRLRSEGFGESRPLVEGTTDEARATNRRVEFRIVGRADGF